MRSLLVKFLILYLSFATFGCVEERSLESLTVQSMRGVDVVIGFEGGLTAEAPIEKLNTRNGVASFYLGQWTVTAVVVQNDGIDWLIDSVAYSPSELALISAVGPGWFLVSQEGVVDQYVKCGRFDSGTERRHFVVSIAESIDSGSVSVELEGVLDSIKITVSSTTADVREYKKYLWEPGS